MGIKTSTTVNRIIFPFSSNCSANFTEIYGNTLIASNIVTITDGTICPIFIILSDFTQEIISSGTDK